jgi:hypothetical protein
MSVTKKLLSLLLVVAMGVAILGAMPLLPLTVSAESSTEEESTTDAYYYRQLSALARKFYQAMETMESTGIFKTGTGEYDLIAGGVLTENEVAAYAQYASTDLLEAYGAARDAFVLDRPDVFYVDFSHLSISVGTKDGAYVATLGTGRSDNYYLRGSDGNEVFHNAAEVDAAIAEYEAALASVIAEAKTYTAHYDRVVAANAALLAATEYSFESTADENGTTYTADEPFIHGAYGALVRGKSVCEGYSKAFKVMMDALGVPCVLVQGYALTNDAYQAHMWNYVQLDDKWYGIDATWNDGDGIADDEYLLLGGSAMRKEHIADGVVSSVGFEFRYPVLNAYGYQDDTDGFDICVAPFPGSDTMLTISVGFDDMNVTDLAKTGKYIAVRFSTTADTNDIQWTVWSYVGREDFSFEDQETRTEFISSTQYRYLQFAIIEHAPDSAPLGTVEVEYTAETAEAYMFKKSAEIELENYGEYMAQPYPVSATPSNSAVLDLETTYDVVITYDEALKRVDATELGVELRREDGSLITGAQVSNFVWSEENPTQISFTLTPSKMYSDSDYLVTPKGLVGKDSNKVPLAVGYRFWRQAIVCDKVYNDGRLYMQVYGAPSLVANEDMSLAGWKDANGNYVAENQRTQLMLVASKPDSEMSDQMISGAASDLGINASDVLSSQTFEINMYLCGCVQTIPNGSYMQIGFGFPDGYGPEDEGVTFKVYHYKKDADGNIIEAQPLDCVITEYGLVVTVTDFSPFAVIAVDKSKVATTTKSIFASVVSGGRLTSTVGTTTRGSGITVLSSGETVTYTFLPNTGYQVDYVMVGGQKRTVTNNTLTLNYADLGENTTLEAYYVANRVVTREAEQGITNIAVPLRVVVKDDAPVVEVPGSTITDATIIQTPVTTAPATTAPASNRSSRAIIVIPILAGVLLLISIAVMVLRTTRRKDS